jgi:hypothetical protein
MLPFSGAVDLNLDVAPTGSTSAAQGSGTGTHEQASELVGADLSAEAVASSSEGSATSQALTSAEALLAERAQLTLESLCPDPAVRELLPAAARQRPWFVALLHELRRQWAFPVAVGTGRL